MLPASGHRPVEAKVTRVVRRDAKPSHGLQEARVGGAHQGQRRGLGPDEPRCHVPYRRGVQPPVRCGHPIQTSFGIAKRRLAQPLCMEKRFLYLVDD